MKRIIVFLVIFLSTFNTVINASAQVAESIWLTASTTTYKTGDIVVVTLNATSVTSIQGFTFQIRYDPSCLKPINASSPILAMSGLPLPQLTGLVDGSYASTIPQTVSGVLAEIRFTALRGCQTGLYLESAALAIRNAEGFAEPLPNVPIGERNISLFIDKEMGTVKSSQSESGSVLPLDPPKAGQGIPGWIIGGVLISLVVAILLLFGVYMVIRVRMPNQARTTKPFSGTYQAVLHVKHGPLAGRSFTLNKFPVLIGRDPKNDICFDDPHVTNRHAQIHSEKTGYYLRDLGGGTFINGHQVNSSTVVLYPGDVVRLGRSVLFVFG